MQGVHIWTLAGELRSHMLCGVAKKHKIKQNHTALKKKASLSSSVSETHLVDKMQASRGPDEVHQVMKVKVLVTQSCLTLFDSMDCSLPGSSVHGILQARILKWVPSRILCVYICRFKSPNFSLPLFPSNNCKFVLYICDSISVL